MKITRHKVDPRRHVVIQIGDGTGDQWAGPHLDGAVVKFEVVAQGEIDTAQLRTMAIGFGAVHVHPIVVRRPKPSQDLSAQKVTAIDPGESLLLYAAQDPPPDGIDLVAMMQQLL